MTSTMTLRYGATLSALVDHAGHLRGLRKTDLLPGDTALIRTWNSVYMVRAVGDGTYVVSGGWFERKGKTNVRMAITGCTWGGSSIKTDVIAACGLCMEFSNRLITSPVRSYIVLRNGSAN